MNAHDEICEINECKHIFHTECINQWLEQKDECPLCKSKIDCYKPFVANEVVLSGLINQLIELHGPIALYFREMNRLNQDVEALNQFQTTLRRIARRERDSAIALNALHPQLRRARAGALNLNRQGNVRATFRFGFAYDI